MGGQGVLICICNGGFAVFYRSASAAAIRSSIAA